MEAVVSTSVSGATPGHVPIRTLPPKGAVVCQCYSTAGAAVRSTGTISGFGCGFPSTGLSNTRRDESAVVTAARLMTAVPSQHVRHVAAPKPVVGRRHVALDTSRRAVWTPSHRYHIFLVYYTTYQFF